MLEIQERKSALTRMTMGEDAALAATESKSEEAKQRRIDDLKTLFSF